jgi:thiol:disulfide interchange protein/DsbC/DsbD-like thiol-disulfide interchange protein
MARSFKRLSFLLVAFVLAAGFASYDYDFDPDDPSPFSDASLVSEATGIVPGQTFTVALRLQHDPDWHSYWLNPADSGLPTTIDWRLPEGFSAGDIQWPYPKRIIVGPLASYGYYDDLLLLVDVTAPADLAPGSSVTLEGTADWLICEEICLTATEELSLTLPVVAETGPRDNQWASAFDATRLKHPAVIPGWELAAERHEDGYALVVVGPQGRRAALSDAHFFAIDQNVIAYATDQKLRRSGEVGRLFIDRSSYAQNPATQLRGVLVAGEGQAWDTDGRRAMYVDVQIHDEPLDLLAGSADNAPLTGTWALLTALGLAFLGGIILNLMPCVFPVLSLKILGFVQQANEERGKVVRHGLSFTAGVLISFWVLAGLLIVLRATGQELGWGFQLQSPVFVGLIALLLFGLALNLMGVFEIGLSLTRLGQAGSSSGYRGSFSSGVLATIVATPCTAPFMGVALGFAMTLPAATSLLVFTSLALGMASPYMLLSASPALMRRLPRPGAWMETFKKILAFPLFATVIWLVWVFGLQTGVDGVTFLLSALMMLGLACWILGHWGDITLALKKKVVSRAVAATAILSAIALTVGGTGGGVAVDGASVSAMAAGGGTTSTSVWQPWSEDAVHAAREAGRPVFIDFTAAWCLSCQVNKRVALNARNVQAEFSTRNVLLLQADWTNRDADIARALRGYGRSGVPLYVLYNGMEDPIFLPELLTEGIVIDALKKITPATASVAR